MTHVGMQLVFQDVDVLYLFFFKEVDYFFVRIRVGIIYFPQPFLFSNILVIKVM